MNRRDFTRLTSLVALSLPCKNSFASIVSFENFQSEQDIKAKSIAAFKRFESVWNFNDFWKRGNTFDACLTFADAMYRKWPADPEVNSIQQKIGEMLEENYKYFMSFDAGKLWADDFGWWGLMAINARKHLMRLGNAALADKYTNLSIHLCWQQERDHAYDFSDTALPVPHGCRNGDADGQNKGVKNTVTNVLLFLLSCRIYRLTLKEKMPDNEKYLDMAYRQWIWFDSWFKLEKYGYLQKLTNGGALVQERPTAFFEGSDYKDITHPTWEKGWVWTGDQGMLLAALTDMLAIKNNLSEWIAKNKIDSTFKLEEFENTLNNYLNLLSKGIKTALTGNTDNIIREAPFNANFGPEFGNDYLAGRGIMMRYMGQLGKKINNIDFNKNTKATAAAIWKTRDTTNNQFKPEFTSSENDKLYVNQYRKLTGMGDDVHQWQIQAMNEQQKLGVCQSIGLDAFGAVINSL
ncbi:MAG: glycoside hydrolase family 76 protein [Ginsengibacter sp.]